MDLNTSRVFSDFINGKILPSDFELWLYEHESLETSLGEEVYFNLILINFKDNSAKYNVNKLVDSLIDYGNLHKHQIIELINNILSKNTPIMDFLYALYHCSELGYNFLDESIVIANYGEQGKSILVSVDGSMTEDEK